MRALQPVELQHAVRQLDGGGSEPRRASQPGLSAPAVVPPPPLGYLAGQPPERGSEVPGPNGVGRSGTPPSPPPPEPCRPAADRPEPRRLWPEMPSPAPEP